MPLFASCRTRAHPFGCRLCLQTHVRLRQTKRQAAPTSFSRSVGCAAGFNLRSCVVLHTASIWPEPVPCCALAACVSPPFLLTPLCLGCLQEEETAAEEDEVEQEEAASLPPLPQQLPPCPGPQQQRAQAQQRQAQWPSAVAPVPAMAAARPPAQRAAASSAQQPLQAITKVAAQRPGQAAADVAAAGQQSLAQEAPPAAVVRQLAGQGAAAAAAAAATAKQQQQQQQQQVQARRPPSQQQEEQRAEPAAAPATQQHYPSPQQLAVPPPVLTPTPWSSQKRPRNQSAASAEPQGSKRQTAPFSVTPTLFNAMAQQAVQQQHSQSAGAVPAVLNPDLSDAARSRAERVSRRSLGMEQWFVRAWHVLTERVPA